MGRWDRGRSRGRIEELRRKVPSATVDVERFGADYLERRRRRLVETGAADRPGELIFAVRPSQAVLVDAVHVYVQLIDYTQRVLDVANETEAEHRRLLQMLHVHYSACDAVAEEFDAQRVDYHGPRMHAVVLTPVGDEAARVERACEFADAVKRTIEEVGAALSRGLYRTRVRIGIDCGQAIAVNGGRGGEPEPLFLGSPANYAAKLSEGEREGIYPSSRVRALLRAPIWRQDLAAERATPLSAVAAGAGARARILAADAATVARAAARVRNDFAEGAGVPHYAFHHHQPPLRTIDFSELSPSNAVRMGMASVFGDLDGFTAYVDRCIASGDVAGMVASLHVIRGELAACLRDDFGGRKVRFIGDCIQGVVAEGTRAQVDAAGSVSTAVAAAAGLRSSFELCRDLLPGAGALDIAIGVELGVSPVCRVGLRGERSVRCCVGEAVSASETLQRSCDEAVAARFGTRALTRLGPRALAAGPASLRAIFDKGGFAAGLDYASLEGHTSTPATVRSGAVSREARPWVG